MYSLYVIACTYSFHNEVINCGPLTDPDNGQVNASNGTTFGRIATYACYRESGSRTCEADGLWTSEEPNCQGSYLQQFNLCLLLHQKFTSIEFSTSTGSSCTTDNSGVVGGVTAAVLITISMVIIALLIGYIVHLRRQLKQQHNKE